MRFRVIRVLQLAALMAATCLAGPAMAQAFDQRSGGPGRVVVIDASGSMEREDYVNRPRQRMDRAAQLFRAYVRRLQDRNDPLPTTVHVFGSELRWSDVAAQYGNDSTRYPHDGPLCQDIRQFQAFANVADATLDRTADRVDGIRPKGMTPIHVALTRALDALDPVHGGEIVLISDLDVINCLPPGQSLCEALQPALSRFADSALTVTVKVFETPASTLADELDSCLSAQGFPYHTTLPDPAQPLDDAFQDTGIELKPRYATQPDVGADTLSLAQIRVTLTPQGVVRPVYDGVPGTIRARPGEYVLSVAVAGQTPRQKRLSIGPVTVEDVPVDPATIRFDLREAGAPVGQQATVVFARKGNPRPLAAPSTLADGQTLRFGSGDYDITARLPDGRQAHTAVTAVLGGTSLAVLDFGSARAPAPVAAGRDVRFDIRTHVPTLAAAVQAAGLAADFSPAVELPGHGVLAPGGATVRLPDGRHAVRIGGMPGLSFDLGAASGSGPVKVTVELVPGWFVAWRRNPGTMRLSDAAGTVIGHFDADRVEHSLPDGAYVLEWLNDEGIPQASHRFVAGPGTAEDIRF